MTESDRRDSAVWQAIHDDWSRFVNAELAARQGKAPEWYRALMADVRDKDGILTDYGLATRGSSSSSLTDLQAFARGYQGGR